MDYIKIREPVKGKTEAGRRREERAWQTRQRIVEAAIELFIDRGYAGTTVEAIANAARVAPATVYQAFGTKEAVLAAGLDRTIAGDPEPVAVLERDWVRRARLEPDPLLRLRTIVEHASEIAARTAPIKAVMRDAAAIEPSIRELIRKDHENRRHTQRALTAIILGTGARSARDVDLAADVFFALVNSDAFQLVSDHLGWTVRRWRAWLVRVLQSELGIQAAKGRAKDG